MPNLTKNVVSGKPLSTGGVLIAPLGTALPTTVSTAPNASFKSAGYIGEDGLVQGGDRNVEKIRAWGGDTVKVVQTEHSLTYQFTFIEVLNTDVLKVIHGDANVAVTAATASAGTLHTVKLTGETFAHRTWIFEVKDGLARIRICVPDGQVTETGEVTYADDEVIGYQVTVECFPDATAVKAYQYTDDGVTV